MLSNEDISVTMRGLITAAGAASATVWERGAIDVKDEFDTRIVSCLLIVHANSEGMENRS